MTSPLTCAACWSAERRWWGVKVVARAADPQTRTRGSCSSAWGSYKLRRPPPRRCCPPPPPCDSSLSAAHTPPDPDRTASCSRTRWNLAMFPLTASSAAGSRLLFVFHRWLSLANGPKSETGGFPKQTRERTRQPGEELETPFFIPETIITTRNTSTRQTFLFSPVYYLFQSWEKQEAYVIQVKPGVQSNAILGERERIWTNRKAQKCHSV